MSGRKHPPKPVIAIVVLALLGTVGWWLWHTYAAQPAASSALSGTVEAKEYQVAAAAGGPVAAVKAVEGAQVKAGDVLVQLDDAAATLQVTQAEAGVTAATAAVTNAKDSGTAADVTAAQARVAQAKAAVDLAKVALGNLAVTAPHDGVVVAVSTNVGQVAAPGRTLVTLRDTKDLTVRIYVPETDLGTVAVGRAASLTTDASATAYAAKVTSVATTAEFTPNTIETKDQRTKLVYEVRLAVTDPTGTLIAGQPVDVTWK